jgi:hypothetical protein
LQVAREDAYKIIHLEEAVLVFFRAFLTESVFLGIGIFTIKLVFMMVRRLKIL